MNPGPNTLKRRSTESTVTIPFDRTFRNLDERPAGTQEAGFNFCGKLRIFRALRTPNFDVSQRP